MEEVNKAVCSGTSVYFYRLTTPVWCELDMHSTPALSNLRARGSCFIAFGREVLRFWARCWLGAQSRSRDLEARGPLRGQGHMRQGQDETPASRKDGVTNWKTLHASLAFHGLQLIWDTPGPSHNPVAQSHLSTIC